MRGLIVGGCFCEYAETPIIELSQSSNDCFWREADVWQGADVSFVPSATGAGQFLDDTWVDAVRRHRRDLIQGRSDKELLELRRDTEIVTRLVEQYATMLSKRRLPITPGSLYLTYFAGSAGAVALLSGAENADAASLMASADLTGRTTREKLVSANPFLKELTVGDLKTWADHKMGSR
jgi:hypothetical protein